MPFASFLFASFGIAGLLADLKSRGATRNTVLVAVVTENDTALASEALDRGADAVCLGGFCVEEVLLRLENQIARKARTDQMRATLRRGIAECRIDPLTGLHNRRYAMQAIKQKQALLEVLVRREV